MRRLASLLSLCLACPAPSDGADATGSSSTSSSATEGASATAMTAPTTGDAADSTTSDATSSGASDSSDSSGANSSDSGGSFVPECHTRLTPEQRLAFTCNLPRVLAECAALPGAPCEDLDADGLTDAWEDLLLAAMRPMRRMDEAEMLLADPAAVTGDVGRVAALADHLRVFVMLGYSIDYGSCGFTGHNGDSERVALDLVPDPEGGPGGALVVGAYTAAHENTASDHGKVFVDAALDQLVYTVDPRTTHPRWVVFPSADKHATYATLAICEAISQIPCLDEDCGPDGVDEPALFDILPPFVNAGEEAAPRVTELSVLGFPGEQAWAAQDFCGGLGGTGCSSPVREKLLVDPF